jgi:hypothetical protein
MKYLEVMPVKKGRCYACPKKASKAIDGVLYCSNCCDTVLMVNLGRCIKNLTHVKVKISVIPISPLYEKEKRASLKKGLK